MGPQTLTAPSRVRATLAVNDRLKAILRNKTTRSLSLILGQVLRYITQFQSHGTMKIIFCNI